MKLVDIKDANAAARRASADEFRDIANRIEAGDIVEWVFVANDRAGQCYMTHSKFEDRWRMLGAIEYARAPFLRGEG